MLTGKVDDAFHPAAIHMNRHSTGKLNALDSQNQACQTEVFCQLKKRGDNLHASSAFTLTATTRPWTPRFVETTDCRRNFANN